MVFVSKRLQFKKIGDYESSLGEGYSEAMTVHQAMSDQAEQSIIQNNLNFSKHMDWKLFEHQANEIVHQKSLEIKAPGWQHVEYTYYLKMPGHDGQIQPGHARETWRGVDGVWVPDAPITKVSMKEKLQSNLKRTLAKPGAGQTAEDQQSQAMAALVRDVGLGGLADSGLESLGSQGFFEGTGLDEEDEQQQTGEKQ